MKKALFAILALVIVSCGADREAADVATPTTIEVEEQDIVTAAPPITDATDEMVDMVRTFDGYSPATRVFLDDVFDDYMIIDLGNTYCELRDDGYSFDDIAAIMAEAIVESFPGDSSDQWAVAEILGSINGAASVTICPG